jgi:D-lactate dehydrogenase
MATQLWASRASKPSPTLPPREPPSPPDVAPLRRRLEEAIDPARVLTRAIDVVAYASDASFYRLVPRAVVQPASEAEVRALFAISQARRLPLTFRAAGTSLSGQAVTDGLLVDLSKHWGRVEVLEGGKRVRVGPGAIGGRVNALLRPFARRIGPDPASIDACMMGGILANNSSGMCCGVAENAFHTLASIRFILPSGLTIDTSDEDAGERLRAGAPGLAAGLLALRARVLQDSALAGRIRAKYRMKNTTGYSLNALIDFDTPEQILAHLLVGSEGTLAFIAEAVLEALPDYPAKRTGLLYFESSARAAGAVEPLARSGARAIEFMDFASLRSVAGERALGVDVATLEPETVALLVEYQCEDAAALEALSAGEAQALAQVAPIFPARFTSDAAARAALWKIRKGLYPAVGATKRTGQTVIIEDVAFPLERLAAAIDDLRALCARHGYADAIIFGHAKDGNVHFVLKQSFNERSEVERYARLMDDLVELVLARHGGAMKAEHGTGRNVAPFVEAEWGREAYAVMKELKALCDPDGLLNPGVILNDDPAAHLKDLKSLPTVDEEIDRCVECGFCEPTCPSRRLTLTPRQRIAVRRELRRLEAGGDGATRAALEADFTYAGLETCAADGLCAVACPVKIDTGALVKRLRGERHGRLALGVAGLLAAQPRLVEGALRLGLRLGHAAQSLLGVGRLGLLSEYLAWLLGVRLPRWSEAIPRVARALPASATGGIEAAEAVYFATCLSRIMGRPQGEDRSLAEVTLLLAERAGVRLKLPRGLEGQCCGLPFGSKGFSAQHGALLRRLVDLLWRESEEGRIPVALDATSCLYTVKSAASLLDASGKQKLQQLQIVDIVELARERFVPRLTLRPLEQSVVLHPNCAARKLELTEALREVAQSAARRVEVPVDLGCCATAGDRGLFFPELTLSAVGPERAEIQEGDHQGFYSSNLTCEIGLRQATGLRWRSVLYLLEEASRPGP